MNKKTATLLAASVSRTTAVGLAMTTPAYANGGNSFRTGPCSMDSTWSLKANANPGGSHKITVELRIRSTMSGEVWNWTLTDRGQLAAQGQSTTEHGNNELREKVQIKNLRGYDKIVLDAQSTVTGETCHGHVLMNGSH